MSKGPVERVIIAELARALPPSDLSGMERSIGARDIATARVVAAAVQLGQAMDVLFTEIREGR